MRAQGLQVYDDMKVAMPTIGRKITEDFGVEPGEDRVWEEREQDTMP